MAITGISQFGGLYNNYRVVDIPQVDVADVKAKEAEAAAASVEAPVAPVAEPVKEDLRTKSADLENISLNFNANDDYSYIGMNFELDALDMEQAISDMKKDKILEDYQYFVGSSSNLNGVFENEDGKVLVKLQ